MPHLIFDMRPCLDAVWVERYRNYLGAAQAIWDDKRRENTQFGVEQSTVRSIPTGLDGPNHGPLAVYNEWAGKQLTLLSKSRERWSTLHQHDEFERWHAELTESLCQHWKQRTAAVAAERTKAEGVTVEPVNSELSIAHRYKLVDLFVRWLRMKGEHAPALAAACVANGHIPLDRKSLHVLSESFGGIGLRGPFSMGHVHTVGAYQFYQALARALCKEAGGTPLLFDVFAWNHPETQALYGK